MKGLELSKKYYEAYGEPMLKEKFCSVLPYVAVGLVGSGSECYGFDDDISKDHDFEPGFCIFLPDEDVVDRKTAFEMEREYAKLPREFMGFERSRLSAVGGNRHGVIRTADFFEAKTGRRDGRLLQDEWFMVPQHSLFEAVNGEIFIDNYGEFSKIRESLCYFPEDVRLKKLAGNLLLMGQSGQYNYKRCVLRGETAAAQLAVFEFVKATLEVIFLLNKTYMPYYKWSFRALRGLSLLSDIAESLEYLISSENTPNEAEKKTEIIENICTMVANELKNQGITGQETAEMERLAYAVNNVITDNIIRNKHILSAV